MEKPVSSNTPERTGKIPSDIEKAFAVDVFESNLRNKQKQLNVDASNPMSYHGEMGQLASQYIIDAGVNLDDEQYVPLYNAAREYSYDLVSDDEWRIGVMNNSQADSLPTPKSWDFKAKQLGLFGRQTFNDGSRYVAPFPDLDNVSNGDSNADTAEKNLDELNMEIESLRKDVGMAYAKRMKVGVFRKKRKAELQAELDEKQSLLAESIAKRDDMTIEQLRTGGNLTDDEIVEKLAEQTDEDLVAQANEQNAAMFVIPKSKESTGRFSKLKNWGKEYGVKAQVEFANATIRRRIAYTAIAAAGVAVAGVAAGGLGAVGAAGIVGTRIARSYTMKRAQLYKTPDQPENVSYKNEDGTVKSIDEFRETSQELRKKVISERIERGDTIKRRAVYGALASSALIGVGLLEHTEVGKEVVGYVKEHVTSGFHNIVDRIKNPDGNNLSMDENPSKDLPSPPALENPTSTPDGPAPNGAPEAPAPAPATELPTTGNDGFNTDMFASAVEVSRGEGWYQTFSELGIMNQADQAKLLNNDVLMAKLSNMNVAYVDHSVGGWGIKMPADGKMPTDALKLIRETAQQSQLTLSR